jgi:predicted O-methyltransferase YrrM
MPKYFENIQGWCDFTDFYTKIADTTKDGDTLVEIGVWKGRSLVFLAEALKENNKLVRLFGIDIFDSCSHELVSDFTKLDKPLQTLVQESLDAAGVSDLVTLIKGDSVETARQFADNSIAFAFIDAAHEYPAVQRDILAWWPKVKPGGILSGHDYGGDWVGVTQAVNEFVKEHKLELNVACKHCWHIRKPN